MTKKKRGQDPEAGDEDGEQSRTPIRSELDKQEGLFPVAVLTPMLIPWPMFVAVSLEKEQTPLQEALNQLIRQLQRWVTDQLTAITCCCWLLLREAVHKYKMCVFFRKDPSAFFSFPVTDLIAPGYSSIIKRPMDFSTMKERVKKDCYQSLDELKVLEESLASIYLIPRTTSATNIVFSCRWILKSCVKMQWPTISLTPFTTRQLGNCYTLGWRSWVR